MSWLRRKERKDVLGGALMTLLGLFTAFEGSSYHIGILARMGPGYFPVALGIILTALGLLIIFNADDAGAPNEEESQESKAPQARGWACIIAGVVAFIVLGKWGGLMPATFSLVFISAMGDSEQTVPKALLLALGTTLVGAFIFSNLLQLQFPLFRWG